VSGGMNRGGHDPNVGADRWVVEIARRIIPGETDPEKVLEPFDRLADAIRTEHPEVDLSFAIGQWTEAAEVTGDPAIADLCRAAVREETGRAALATGFTA